MPHTAALPDRCESGQPLGHTVDVDDLGSDLRAAGYDAERVPALLGTSAELALGRGEFWPALHRTSAVRSALSTLTRLFLLGATEPESQVAQALPQLGIERAIAAGVLERVADGCRAGLDIRPHSDDSGTAADLVGYLVISDLDSDTRPGPVAHEHVLGIGQASLSLARAVIRHPVERALDIGTGCGIQALHLDHHAGSIVATDTNPRALALAAATARINGMHWDLRSGSLFEPVAGEQFDLIVSNPPFVIGTGEQQYIYRDSGMAGDAICEQLVRGAAVHLRPGGVMQLLANWLVIEETDWRTRVSQWLADSGLDAWVVQREFADPVQYVSLWLQDAGEEPATAAASGVAWLDWFAHHRVSGIGMGSITLRRKTDGESGPVDVVFEEITGTGEEVTGQEADAFLARRRYLRGTSEQDLLRTVFRLAPTVVLDERSLLGDDGFEAVLRMAVRVGGPGATLQVDDWGRALLAGCTSSAPLNLVIELLAAAHDVDVEALTAAVLPSIKVAIGRGILEPVPAPQES